MSRSEKSFTLIELLVVIAIIGLLASIVLVSMSGMQGRARITKTLEFSQSLQRNLGAYAVGVWSFDDQTNPTKDGSGYNNNGTLVNGPTFSLDTPHLAVGVGTGKYALSFDGVDDYVNAGNGASLNITNNTNVPWTVETWVKVNSYPGNKAFFVDKGYISPYELGIASNGQVTFYMRFVTAGVVILNSGAGKTLGLNTWRHVVGTFDGDSMKIYIDGSLANSNSGYSSDTLRNINPTLGVVIGKEYGVWYFNGLIDEVRIYEKALTLGEIQKRYADGLQSHSLVLK